MEKSIEKRSKPLKLLIFQYLFLKSMLAWHKKWYYYVYTSNGKNVEFSHYHLSSRKRIFLDGLEPVKNSKNVVSIK